MVALEDAAGGEAGEGGGDFDAEAGGGWEGGVDVQHEGADAKGVLHGFVRRVGVFGVHLYVDAPGDVGGHAEREQDHCDFDGEGGGAEGCVEGFFLVEVGPGEGEVGGAL